MPKEPVANDQQNQSSHNDMHSYLGKRNKETENSKSRKRKREKEKPATFSKTEKNQCGK